MPKLVVMKAHGKRRFSCSDCESLATRNETYDAYLCPVCEVWLESACTDPTCEFCVKRPATPSLASL